MASFLSTPSDIGSLEGRLRAYEEVAKLQAVPRTLWRWTYLWWSSILTGALWTGLSEGSYSKVYRLVDAWYPCAPGNSRCK